MSSIELPDPVIAWEAEGAYDLKNSYTATFTIRAVVGDVTIFESIYYDDGDYRGTGAFAYDLEDAQKKAATAFGTQLRRLLEGPE